ncbi:MAG: ABC transporter ATP-binding protein [Bacillota bacterium]
MDIAVSVKNLTKKYKLYEDKWGPIKEVVSKKKLHNEFLALKDVSIDFPKGESIGVLGKNGSGKSTLLKIITGIAEPTSGTVTVNGSLVFLDVSSGIDSELSGYENIFMKGILLGYTKEEMLEKVEDIIEFSELGEFINQPVKNYSSGMKSKLGFAISVNVNPDILIVDEALAVGDSHFREKCMNKMNDFKREGKTIIFVSHDKNAVESFCSKAAWIHKGELITYGDSKFVGSMYNDFMSGKKTLEGILSEIKFIHEIEHVVVDHSHSGLKMTLQGYLYDTKGPDEHDFNLIVRDDRTGEFISKPLIRGQHHPDIKEKGRFSVQISEEEFSGFFKPGRFSIQAGYVNECGEPIEFPLWAGQVKFQDEVTEIQNVYNYTIKRDQNRLFMTVDNLDKVQQQVNHIWSDQHILNIEGVAFVRGYETPAEDTVAMNLHLVNLESFEEFVYPAVIRETEEITENQSFNPQGKNYNFSKFEVALDTNEIPDGKYECKLSYHMKKVPGHKLMVLVWASKSENYPQEPYVHNRRAIDVQTATKYLQIELRNNS